MQQWVELPLTRLQHTEATTFLSDKLSKLCPFGGILDLMTNPKSFLLHGCLLLHSTVSSGSCPGGSFWNHQTAQHGIHLLLCPEPSAMDNALQYPPLLGPVVPQLLLAGICCCLHIKQQNDKNVS